jgi:anti-sigma B factor antagonist
MVANPARPAPELTFETEKTASEMTVRCTGTINSNTTDLLKTTVRNLMLENKTVVLDLGNVSYMDSSGLGAMVALYVSAKRSGCTLKVVKLNDRLKELFSIARLAPLFEGHEDMLGMTPD